MEKINPNDLFSIFEKGDEEVYQEHGVSEVLSNPFVLMGMVTTGVNNFTILDAMYKQRYPEKYKEVRHKIMYTYFNRLYSYLSRIDIDSIEVKYKVGETYDISECHDALDILRLYYENIEEYEKCGLVLKFTKLLYGEKLLVLN